MTDQYGSQWPEASPANPQPSFAATASRSGLFSLSRDISWRLREAITPTGASACGRG